jgi:hypothetical protein
MTLQDFNKDEYGNYTSKERFWFENDKVKFWYRLYLTTHTYQPGWSDDVWETRYQVLLLVDDESVHENHKECFFPHIEHGFFLKEVEKRGKFSEGNLEKILNSALKLKIENKIKVDKYQKILGILNGEKYYI